MTQNTSSIKNEKVYSIVAVAFMAALVFISSKLSIPFVTITGEPTRLHLGNAFCLLSGLLFGSLKGGLAAGIGSMFFDFTDPLYIASAPFTFVFKFMMAFVCGSISYNKKTFGKSPKINIVASACGAFTYVLLYLSKGFIANIFFNRVELETALISLGQKAVTSSFNAVVAVIIAVPLAAALKASLKHVNLYKKAAPQR